MLNAILDHLSEQDEYRRTVHEKDVLSIMKKWVACVYEAEGGESYEYEPSDITGCKIHAHIAAALEKIREWVEGSYVRKAKLTSTMAESILDAIKEYAHDAAHGEPEQPSIYLRKEGMSSEEYRKKYREIYRHILVRFDEEMPSAWRKGSA